MSDAWILSTADLAALGLGDKAVRRLVANGQLVRLRRGHYRRPLPSDSQNPHTWPIGESEARHRFVLEATRPALAGDSVFSHASAATLHGLPVPARLLDRAYITRPGDCCREAPRREHPPLRLVDRTLDRGEPAECR